MSWILLHTWTGHFYHVNKAGGYALKRHPWHTMSSFLALLQCDLSPFIFRKWLKMHSFVNKHALCSNFEKNLNDLFDLLLGHKILKIYSWLCYCFCHKLHLIKQFLTHKLLLDCEQHLFFDAFNFYSTLMENWIF